MGNYADFFPTAPSVVKERKTTRHHDDATARARSSLSSNERGLSARSGVQSNVKHPAPQHHPPTSNTTKAVNDDVESYSGDLLNGAGSASSASTVSSIFSDKNQLAMNGHTSTTTLTPLTNTELSPRVKLTSPSFGASGKTVDSNSDYAATHTSGALTPQHTPPATKSCPRNMRVQGSKRTYDPEHDKTVPREKRGKLAASYADFEHNTRDGAGSSDPRLKLSGYSSGRCGKGKGKLRHEPHNLKTWYQSVPAPSPAPSLPTAVVVTGFDPMIPVSQITHLFSMWGEIADIDNKTDPVTGRFLGICSIIFQDCASWQGGGPLSATLAAKTAYLEGKRGQRIGLNTITIHIDKDGLCQKLVDAAIAKHRKESGFSNKPKPVAVPPPPPVSTPPAPAAGGFAKVDGPPPTAPRGPAAKQGARPGAPAPTSATYSLTKLRQAERDEQAKRPSLVEAEPIAETLKNTPYVFISHASVPVLSTTIPHLKKRLRMYDWRDIKCDATGYFIIFDATVTGRMEAKKTYHGSHMHPLFTYTMQMDLCLNGNITAASAISQASPIVPLPANPTPMDFVKQKQQFMLRRERDFDVEEEKRQRAKDMDPSRAVVQLVIQELREKLMDDVKARIAAPVLYDYLDPDRHVDKRRRLGIEDPPDARKSGLDIDVRRATGSTSLNLLSMPKIGKRRGEQSRIAGYRDERRKAPPSRTQIRPLFHQLSQWQDEDDSEDENRTSITRDTEDPESRPASRMSMTSVSDSEDELIKKVAKRRLHAREESEMGDAVIKEEPDVIKQSAVDLVIAKLERNIDELSGDSRKRKRLVKELQARKRQKDDEELFGVHKVEVEREPSIEPTIEFDTPTEATPEPDAVKALKAKPKPRKKTKKQITEEKEAARRAQAEAEAEEYVDNVMEIVEEEEALAEAAERRPEVEWGVSADHPQPTVDDDDDIVPDLRGWQATLVDDEDVDVLDRALMERSVMDIGNPKAWAWVRERIRNLQRNVQPGIVRHEPIIQGYYVPNRSGAARLEPITKILESEKSKYLPHRIKVQKAREKRQAEATKEPAAIVKTQIDLPKASSRGKRADDRRTIKELDRQREMLHFVGASDESTDALSFNQLQKRKKPVKFARSAIHNWGLYSLEHINASEMIIEYVGERIRQEIADLREIRYTESGIGSSYLFRIDEGTVVDATKKGGIARFINHSCSPNCTAKIIRVGGTKRIVIYALRDIEKGKLTPSSWMVARY